MVLRDAETGAVLAGSWKVERWLIAAVRAGFHPAGFPVAWLDTLMREGDEVWLTCGPRGERRWLWRHHARDSDGRRGGCLAAAGIGPGVTTGQTGWWIGDGDGALLELDYSHHVYNELGERVS